MKKNHLPKYNPYTDKNIINNATHMSSADVEQLIRNTNISKINIKENMKNILVGFANMELKNSFHFCIYNSFNVFNINNIVYNNTIISIIVRGCKFKNMFLLKLTSKSIIKIIYVIIFGFIKRKLVSTLKFWKKCF
jgi:hypothetical protein